MLFQETLFYTHVLSIPVFGVVSQDILQHAVHLPRHIYITLLLLELTWYGAAAVMTRFGCLCWGSSHEEWCCLYLMFAPRHAALCADDVLILVKLQYVCIRGVYWLIGLTSSLTCNFVLR